MEREELPPIPPLGGLGEILLLTDQLMVQLTVWMNLAQEVDAQGSQVRLRLVQGMGAGYSPPEQGAPNAVQAWVCQHLNPPEAPNSHWTFRSSPFVLEGAVSAALRFAHRHYAV